MSSKKIEPRQREETGTSETDGPGMGGKEGEHGGVGTNLRSLYHIFHTCIFIFLLNYVPQFHCLLLQLPGYLSTCVRVRVAL